MNRRGFLKSIGIGAVGLSIPALKPINHKAQLATALRIPERYVFADYIPVVSTKVFFHQKQKQLEDVFGKVRPL